ncbi:hypothetical protein O7635_21980 [Asanoa sp. WMMD1127]|nr:hypothetical protein [Asanoa sp. WMMD1127]MDG4824530.1 hypothetical protein [Asanoa sp. WMMD1127]
MWSPPTSTGLSRDLRDDLTAAAADGIDLRGWGTPSPRQATTPPATA